MRKRRPKIIGITGSYGKTSAKEAIYHLLKKKFKTFRSKKSMNTEFGFSLSIFDLESAGMNPLKWFWILLQATYKTLFWKLPHEIMVMEYGADKPGDIEYLMNIAKPDIGILTTVAPAHLGDGHFESVEAIFQEKKKILEVKEKIFFGDNEMLKKLPKENAKTFGLTDKNDISAEITEADFDGIRGTVFFDGKPYKFSFKTIGRHHITIFLAALLAGYFCGVPVPEGIEILKDFDFADGRFEKRKGKNGSIILDSSYNASPETVEAALRALKELPAKRKIAVLGSMNELGKESERFHRGIGKIAAKTSNYLITVGEEAMWISEEALKNGMDRDRIKTFHDAAQAGKALREILQKDDLVLVKGSRSGIALEKAVSHIINQ